MKKINEELLDFISKSPTIYHCVNNVSSELEASGFVRRNSGDGGFVPGGKYYTVFSDAAVIAYRLPEKIDNGVNPKLKIVASHGDSPCFKLKPKAEQACSGVVRLMTERYGGMIYSTWLDRPLKLAGRVLVKSDAGVKGICVMPEGYAVIPNVAIHQNRKINSGFEYNPQTDLQALWSGGETPLMSRLAASAGVSESEILDYDLYLYNPDIGMIWGSDSEFVSAPRLDDLQCVFSTMKGFLAAEASDDIQVFAVFDNEEVGSHSSAGADSMILSETVRELCNAFGLNLLSLASGGFMLSADNAHALHPNHPEFSDPNDRPVLNGGVVIKYNASQNYMTSAFGGATLRALCEANSVKYQTFVNRSDAPGGSTLGSISTTQLPLVGADIGIAQLAMHSAYETSGALDTPRMAELVKAYFA